MQKGDRIILLSFDVEEFDLPLEYGQAIPLEEQLQTGFNGLTVLQPLLEQPNLFSTLFTTAFFASAYPDTLRQLAVQHEIGSHTYYHSRFKTEDLKSSRLKLEEITGAPITGLRMPRMTYVQPGDVEAAGFRYNSSINPTWLPGRYNNLRSPRQPFLQQGVIQVPTSVTPLLRIPLFWLAFKNMPYSLYWKLALRTLKKDGYLLLYFHPWEFIDLSAYALPGYVKKASNQVLLGKLKRLVSDLSNEGQFCTVGNFVQQKSRFHA
jgi:peptidoglycan/xylan/chitin deacetylase (PgdA/CDA1 family)